MKLQFLSKKVKGMESILVFMLLFQNLLLFTFFITDITLCLECYLTVVNPCPF